jgi:hypothetical protein
MKNFIKTMRLKKIIRKLKDVNKQSQKSIKFIDKVLNSDLTNDVKVRFLKGFTNDLIKLYENRY